jgi:pyruvate dehydrogenase E1 component alpha subunit
MPISAISMDESLAKLENFKREVMQELKAPPELSVEDQLEIFRKMALIREFDTNVKDLWKQNFIYGLAHAYLGAEAVAVGACTALKKGDFITSTHRGHGHVIAMGGDVKKMMSELMGKADGYCKGKGGSMHIASVDDGMLGATGIVGSGMPIAVGSALSAQVLKKDYVTVCFHGDGGTNQGIWHESLNLASTWNLPVIFLCENNQWAISLPYEKASKNPVVADRAIGYGIPGVTVDGFNPFAVYSAVRDAAVRARKGEGPTLIEARYYRYIGHFVADDERYRDTTTNNPWAEQMDPLKRMREYLVKSGTADEAKVESVYSSAAKEVQQAIEHAKAAPEPSPDTLYNDIYSPEFIQKFGGDL